MKKTRKIDLAFLLNFSIFAKFYLKKKKYINKIMVKVKCKFCNNTFQNFSILNHHQKNAKYCLEIQIKEKQAAFQCQFCTKTLSSKQSLDRHSKICNIKNVDKKGIESSSNILEKYNMKCRENVEMRQEIIKYQQEIQRLQTKIEEIAMQTKQNITINNKINQQVIQLNPITDQYLSEQAQNFTISHFKNGLDGISEYAIEYPLKNAITCSDQNRQQFNWRDGDNGNHVICDSKMYHLTRKLGKSLQEKSETLLTEVITEVEEKYNDLIYQHTQNNETIEVEYYQEKLVDLKKLYMDYKDNITKLADGDLGNVIQKFSKLMSMKLPKYKMIEN